MQHHNWLEQKYRAIFSYTGLISAISGITIISPLIALIAYPEEIELTWFFLIPGLFWLYWVYWFGTNAKSHQLVWVSKMARLWYLCIA